MKKVILTVFLFLVFGFGAWYAQEKIKELTVVEPKPSTDSVFPPISNDTSKPAQDPLKDEAIKLVRRPLIVMNDLSSKSLTNAKAKINNAINMIEANYNYDAPWLELGAYRKLIGDNDGAIEAWQFLAKIRPNALVPYHNIGEMYAFTIHDYEKGEQYLLKSIEVGPGNIQGYVALANLYSVPEFGKQSEIPKVLLRGIESNPEDVNLYPVLASYYRDSGDTEQAIKYFTKALLLMPDNKIFKAELDALKAKK